MSNSRIPKPTFLRLSVFLAMLLVAGFLFMSMGMPRNAVQAQSCLITDHNIYEEPSFPVGNLPARWNTFTDPTFCTTIMRVTDGAGSDGSDCHHMYSYWPTFNKDSTKFFIAIDNQFKLYSFDPNNFQITDKTALYNAPPTGEGYLSTEDAAWSAITANLLFGYTGLKLYSYDVGTHGYSLIHDFTGSVSANYLGQMSKSDDDNMFAFLIKGPDYAPLGYVVWQRDSNTIQRNIALANLDEVQLDKTGRYLVVKAVFDSTHNVEVQDLQTGVSTRLTNDTPDYGPGHSDNGRGFVVGYDNYNNRYTGRSLATPHTLQTVFDEMDWSQSNHVSMLAANEAWAVLSNFTSGSDTERPFRQEIFQVSTDGNASVRRLAHHHSVYRDYWDTPRANISRDGKFITFTSNWGSTTRRDVFIIKVPAYSGCSYGISPHSQSFASSGGTGSITVTPIGTSCSWTATPSDTGWITINSGSSGTGNGTVNFTVGTNTGAARNGSITIQDQTFSISQAGADTGVQNVIWTNVANCSVSGNSLTKNGGGSGSCDGGAWSQQAITQGGGYVEFTATETNKIRRCGLASTPSNNNVSSLDFSIKLEPYNSAGLASVIESGTYKTDTTFAANDVFRILIDSGVAYYYKNGTLFYTSAKTPSFPLYADAVLCDLSSTITNAKILTSSCVYSIAPTSASIGSGGGTGAIFVTVAAGCSWTATSGPSWITVTSGGTGSGNGTVNYSVDANSGNARNGAITVAGQTFSISQAAGSSVPENVIWTNAVHTTVSGNSLQKTSGDSSGCDAGAWSQQSITTGGGYLEFTATEINKRRFCGVTSTHTNNNYTLLDFSLRLEQTGSQGLASVMENGIYQSGQPDTYFAANDVFRITAALGVVKYYKNGTLFYTSTKTPTFPLYADAVLCDTNSTITNAKIMTSGCMYTLSPILQSFAAASNTGTITVSSASSCTWTSTSNAGWISITSGSTGSGNGTVGFSITANSGSTIRNGTISVNNQTFTVYQGIDFSDVSSSDPFYDYIGRLSARGVTLGCGGGNYCPTSNVTREQMAAFLLRALGEFSPPTPASQRFADVPSSNGFYNFIDRLAVLEITLGCGGGNYCPSSAVTREQMSAFLLRALGEFSPPTPGSQRFNDVPSSNVFYNFIDRIAVLQISLGCSASPPLYCPSDSVTRAQMAAFLCRAFNL